MRGVGKLLTAAVVAASGVAAAPAGSSVRVEDPCRDVGGVDVLGVVADVGYDGAFDLEALELHTVVLDDELVGADLVLDVCGEAARLPRRGEEAIRVEWRSDEGCRVTVDVGSAGGVGSPLVPDTQARVERRCDTSAYYLLGRRVHQQDADLVSSVPIRTEGDRIVVELRRSDLGELGALVDAGARFGRVEVFSQMRAVDEGSGGVRSTSSGRGVTTEGAIDELDAGDLTLRP